MTIIEFIQILKARKLIPEKIEIAEWHSWTLVSCYSGTSSKYISESVAMGIDVDPNTALAKAITEFLERKLGKESEDKAARLTERSDGFAAFPVYADPEFSKRKAKQNAFGEAVERFVWATWWDDESVSFKIEDLNTEVGLLIKREFQLRTLREVTVPTSSGVFLKILLAETANGGFVTGGAAGTPEQKEEVFSRAFGELLRHLIVVKKMTSSERSTMSFYERRLWGFASGEWSGLVLKRLEQKSEKILELPPLVVNQSISHPHADLVSIHRCLFENQPLFIGGPLERLCI